MGVSGSFGRCLAPGRSAIGSGSKRDRHARGCELGQVTWLAPILSACCVAEEGQQSYRAATGARNQRFHDTMLFSASTLFLACALRVVVAATREQRLQGSVLCAAPSRSDTRVVQAILPARHTLLLRHKQFARGAHNTTSSYREFLPQYLHASPTKARRAVQDVRTFSRLGPRTSSRRAISDEAVLLVASRLPRGPDPIWPDATTERSMPMRLLPMADLWGSSVGRRRTSSQERLSMAISRSSPIPLPVIARLRGKNRRTGAYQVLEYMTRSHQACLQQHTLNAL